MTEEESKAFDAGARGGNYFGSNYQAYKRGKALGEYKGKLGEASNILLFLFGMLMRFLVLYSPFILLGYLCISPFNNLSRLFYNFSFSALAKFVALLAIPSYLFFCIFQFLRGIVLEARKKNVGYWLSGYLAMLLFVTICPSVVTFMLLGLVFGNGHTIVSNNFYLLLFQFVFSVIVFYKSYKSYDLLNESGSSKAGEWAFNIGQNIASKRYNSIDFLESFNNKKTKSPKKAAMYFLIVWAIFSYLIFYITFIIFFALDIILLKTGNDKMIVLLSFYSSSFLCWKLLKNEYKKIFAHLGNPTFFGYFPNKLFLIMAAVLFISIIVVPLRFINFPLALNDIKSDLVFFVAPILSFCVGIIWVLKFGSAMNLDNLDVKSIK